MKTYFRWFSVLFCFECYCSYQGLGGGEGGGGENAVRCLVCSFFFARDLINLICLKYIGFLLICYLVILLDSVIYCSL
jgi:hypothetical protein